MSNLSDMINEETQHETKLHIKVTDKEMFVDGGWSKEKLLSLLKDKLVRRHEIKSSHKYSDVENESVNKLLYSIIRSGTYNKSILSKLEEKGVSPHSIMKAMKYGLLSLNPDELKYFQDFGAEIQVIKNLDMWTKKLDERLIWNLIVAGLTENQCWNIIMCGLVSQNINSSELSRLLSSGIDVLGILNWPGQIKSVTSTIIQFLEKLGIDENTLDYVKENGIDDEIENMLIDLGYNEYKEKEATEEILCECSLTILETFSATSLSKTETSSCNLSKTIPSSSISNSASIQYILDPFTCTCHVNLPSNEENNETLKRNNYLRQNVMVPLSWAINRALRYKPSDPIHYIAHQLLRWKYDNVSEEEMFNAQQFVISATIAMDQKLVEKQKREDAIGNLSETTIKNIDCEICLKRQKLYRIKERCWKCTKASISV